MRWMRRLTIENDAVCISELHMDRATFKLLCQMVRDVGCLKPTRNTSIEEVVAISYTLWLTTKRAGQLVIYLLVVEKQLVGNSIKYF